MIRIIKCRKGKDRMENAVMKKKAVIFDMDGVLIDSEPVYLQLFRDLLRENGCVIDEEKMRVLAGASGSRLWGGYVSWKRRSEASGRRTKGCAPRWNSSKSPLP